MVGRVLCWLWGRFLELLLALALIVNFMVFFQAGLWMAGDDRQQTAVNGPDGFWPK